MRSTIGLLTVSLSLNLFLAAAWDYSQNGFDWTGLGQCGEKSTAAVASNSLAVEDATTATDTTTAGTNTLQSPINLPATAAAGDAKVWMKYPNLGQMMKLYNNGKSLALTIPEGFNSGFGLGSSDSELAGGSGDTFRLAQVNFHSPSEHELNGKRMPLEMQLVHNQVTGSGTGIAVVSVLFASGSHQHDTFLDVIIGNGLPEDAWHEGEINHGHYSTASEGLDMFDAMRQVLDGAQFYSYTGSLTTPPCDPGVKYFVKKAAAPAHSAQLEQFQKAMKKTCPPYGNFRRIPAFTTAADSVEVLQSVDTISGATSSSGGSSSSTAASSPISTGQRERVLEDPQYQTVGANDTAELKTAKTNFQAANLDHSAAVTANSNAKQSLSVAEQQLELASGVADKLDRTWKVFAAQTAVTDSTKGMDTSQTKLDETIKTIIDLEKEAAANASAAAPAPAAAEAAAAPAVATYVPTGQAANPFADVAAAETVVRVGVGAGMAHTASPRLGPNLRPDGPHVPASVQAATVATVAVNESAATSAAAENKTTALIGTAEMVAVLPVDAKKVGNVTEFQLDFAKAVAESAGVAPGRVKVTEIAEADFTPIGKASAASLAQLRGVRRLRSAES